LVSKHEADIERVRDSVDRLADQII
jgi:hypothetical protein